MGPNALGTIAISIAPIIPLIILASNFIEYLFFRLCSFILNPLNKDDQKIQSFSLDYHSS